LTASRTNSYDKIAANSNAAAAGVALDSAGSSSHTSDMTTVLNTLDNLGTSQISAALDTVVPTVDSGVFNTSVTCINEFIGVSIERIRDTLRLAANTADSANTGFSAGDNEKLNGIWAKGYGSYLNQGERKGIQGYDAWNAGTAIGIDRIVADLFTFGVSGGWAYSNIDSDANNSSTYVNSAQSTIYAGYRNDKYPYFIDLDINMVWIWFDLLFIGQCF